MIKITINLSGTSSDSPLEKDLSIHLKFDIFLSFPIRVYCEVRSLEVRL